MAIARVAVRGLSLLFSLGGLALPSAPELTIQIGIYNYSSVSGEALAGVERETARIFRRLGITVEWRQCPLTAEQRAQNASCDGPKSAARFTVRLLSYEMTQRLRLGNETYGFAHVPSDGTFGTVADVFADRTRELAAEEDDRRVLLGHFIAHELGHLLLGDGAHVARSGIMHVPWLTEEVEQAKRGGLLFLGEQAKKIRAQVLARIMAERPPSGRR